MKKRLWSWGVYFDIQNNKIFAKNIRYPIFLRFYLERMDQNLRDGTKFNRYIYWSTHHFSEHGERERWHVTYQFMCDCIRGGMPMLRIIRPPFTPYNLQSAVDANKYMIYDKQNVPNPELLVFLSYLNNLLIYGTRLYGNKSILFLR